MKVSTYNQDQIIMYHDDCLNVFSSLANDSIDLIVTSPPYCMGKEYESISDDIESFISLNKKVLAEAQRVIKKGGSICWQIGFHVKDSVIVPLDCLIYEIVQQINEPLSSEEKLYLHNRIIWSFGHGLNAEKRLSGRYETIMWFTKGKDYVFNLDEIRIPQKYPGKKYSKGKKAGQFSGNPLGKNPSDVWDIPNVKANHVEKTKHPCQFPIAIPQRLIKALTNPNGVVLDPFSGSGTTAIACIIEGRKFIGCEIKKEYIQIAGKRIIEALKGKIKYRPDVPVIEPDIKQKVAQKPEEFKW
ncbi:MAG TPA: site-specific DNA-methyltransferase [Candidatus Enterosoma merdigallinarum]|nr:site-specific DNA-methyltransferase [Candidatus Enterosoma merdigallinarum]